MTHKIMLHLSLNKAFIESDIETLRVIYNTYDTEQITECFDMLHRKPKANINDEIFNFICESSDHKDMTTKILSNMICYNELTERINKILSVNTEYDNIVSVLCAVIEGLCCSDYNRKILDIITNYYGNRLTIDHLYDAIQKTEYKDEYIEYIFNDMMLYILNYVINNSVKCYDVKIIENFIIIAIENNNSILDKLLEYKIITDNNSKYLSSDYRDTIERCYKPDDYVSLFSEDV